MEPKKITPFFGLLKSAIEIYKNNFAKVILAYLIGAISIAAFALSIILLGLKFALDLQWWYVILIMLVLIAAAIYCGVLSAISQRLLLQNNFKALKITLRSAHGYFWKFFGLSLLGGVLILLWSLLLIIPGIIFGVFYSMMLYVLICEDLTGMAAIRRSKELVKGNWWRVFRVMAIFAILSYAVMLVFALPGMIFPETSLFTKIWQILTNLVVLIINPLYVIFLYLVYLDLRKLKA